MATVLEFIDSVCDSGEWATNDKTASLRVIYDGRADWAWIQAIFEINEDTGIITAAWYYNSKEIEAEALYREFYPG